MDRRWGRVLICVGLGALPERAMAGPPADASSPASLPEIQWTIHVLYRPSAQEVRVPLVSGEGPVPVRAPWQCVYQRTLLEQEEIVKLRCVHTSGAVVGTLAICRKEMGRTDLAQLSIGVDGVAAYETVDVSCSVPRDGASRNEPLY